MARSLFPPDGPDQGQVMRLPGHSEGGEQNIKRKVCACHTVCVRACACVCVCECCLDHRVGSDWRISLYIV